MRYADRLTLIHRVAGGYNPDKGEFDQDTDQEEVIPCLVVDLGLEKGKLIFGDYEKERKVAYLQRPYSAVYRLCRYKDKLYKVVTDRQSKTILYLEGDDSLG